MGGLDPVQVGARKAVDKALRDYLVEGMTDWELHDIVWELLRENTIFASWYPSVLVYFGIDTTYEKPHEPTGRQLKQGDLVIVDATPIRKGRDHIDLGDYCSTILFGRGNGAADDLKEGLVLYAQRKTVELMEMFGRYYGEYVAPDREKAHNHRLPSMPVSRFYQMALATIERPIGEMLTTLVNQAFKGNRGAERVEIAREIDMSYRNCSFVLIGGEVGHRVDESLLGNDPRESLCLSNRRYLNEHPIWSIGPHIGIRNSSGKLLPFAAKFEDCMYYGKSLAR